MSALASLIDQVEGRNEWTDRRVVQQAADAGWNLTKSDVSRYRQLGMPTLMPDKVHGLAAGLKLPTYRVLLAVLDDYGLTVPMDVRSVEDAIHHDPELSANTRETLLMIVARERQATR